MIEYSSLDSYMVNENQTLFDLIKKINLNGKGFAIPVDKYCKVKGIFTDGDIRRLLIKRINLNFRIKDFIKKKFIYFYKDTFEEKNLSRQNAKQIPILHKNRKLFGIYFNLSENDDFNLVYPNVYVGNYSTSTNYKLLKDLGITHIISVIPSFNPPFADKFKYLHIEAYDDESQDIKKYFEISNEFITKCLQEGGKILIHCMVGRSRSVTIFLAFLIYIIQGNFNKNILNLEECNDIYNS
jgi:hypothetical protein